MNAKHAAPARLDWCSLFWSGARTGAPAYLAYGDVAD